MIKGIFYSDAKYIIALDCDLQHPPQLIPQMIEALEDGYDAILMKRIKNLDAGLIRSFTSKMYYKFINCLLLNRIFGITPFGTDFFEGDRHIKKRGAMSFSIRVYRICWTTLSTKFTEQSPRFA